MNAYARLAIFLGIATALLVFATQHALQRGNEIASVLAEKPAAARTSTTKINGGSSMSDFGSAQATAAQYQATPEGKEDLFAKLAAAPAGAEAIALTQKLDAAITAENVDQYIAALVTTDHIAIERATHAALSRTADSAAVTKLAAQFGTATEQGRGRILQCLEQLQNPAAYAGLVSTVRADTSEKGSPILGSAMFGLASIGSPEAAAFIVSQVPTQNEFFALKALERLSTPDARRVVEGALAGNKDGTGLDANSRRLVADAVGAAPAK
jgi:hypothetical protein